MYFYLFLNFFYILIRCLFKLFMCSNRFKIFSWGKKIYLLLYFNFCYFLLEIRSCILGMKFVGERLINFFGE